MLTVLSPSATELVLFHIMLETSTAVPGALHALCCTLWDLSLIEPGVVSVLNYLQPDGFIAGMIFSWMKTPEELDADTAARLTATRKNRLALVDDRDRPAKTAVRAWGCDVGVALIVVNARAFVGGVQAVYKAPSAVVEYVTTKCTSLS